MIYVLDASAMLAYLHGEVGSDVVENAYSTPPANAWRIPSTCAKSITSSTGTTTKRPPKLP
jgi:PIN domain nuclease of toxin-antitoxin system